MSTRARHRFHGQIAGVGSSSGTRVVVGHWRTSPLGSFADAMVERADGHRVLLAPEAEVAQFIAATYAFDEIRIEPFQVTEVAETAGETTTWQVRSDSLRLDVVVGSRTLLGRLVRLVPARVATATWWCALVDPLARVVLRGVRTRGSIGERRREWYGATDHHRVVAASGSFDGADLGSLAAVTPPPRFGFSSTPPRPSVTRVTTTIEVSGPPDP